MKMNHRRTVSLSAPMSPADPASDQGRPRPCGDHSGLLDFQIGRGLRLDREVVGEVVALGLPLFVVRDVGIVAIPAPKSSLDWRARNERASTFPHCESSVSLQTAAQNYGAAGRAALVTRRTRPALLVAGRGPDAW